jgi:hypothetical protein
MSIQDKGCRNVAKGYLLQEALAPRPLGAVTLPRMCPGRVQAGRLVWCLENPAGDRCNKFDVYIYSDFTSLADNTLDCPVIAIVSGTTTN